MAIIFHLFSSDAILKQIQFEGEYRSRFERRLNKDYNALTRDNRSDLLQRVRLTAKWKGPDGWSALAQYQYGHTEMWTPAFTGSDETSDLLQLNVTKTSKKQKVTIGRQKINLGSERLIGSLEWVNRSRSFDALRFQNTNLDIWGASIAVQNKQPQKVRLVGATLNSKNGATSLIYKHDSTPAKVDIYTFDHATKVTVAGVDFESETAVQIGRNAGKDQEAWAVHLGASRKLSPNDNVSLEFNSASGGSTAKKSRTFDNLYPTNHKFYGVMDMHAWKNLNQVALSYSHKIRKDIDFKTRFAKSWLRDSKDAWYGASGAANTRAGGSAFIDATGAAGRDLGTELDFESTWKQSARQNLSLGVGIYSPGRFVRTLSGQRTKQYFGYLQYNMKF